VSATKYSVADHGEKIRAFLDRILPLAGLRVDYTMVDDETPHPEFENPDVRVKFTGEDAAFLTANRMEVLLALEHLTMEALHMPAEDHSKICFDANDHRLLRIEELRASAAHAAERVKSTHSPYRFNPMNSRERRILHLALRGETSLRSESEGLEPRRCVVVYPAGMPSRPAEPQRPTRPQGPPRRRR
jgi:spoIIIJ-associated protein